MLLFMSKSGGGMNLINARHLLLCKGDKSYFDRKRDFDRMFTLMSKSKENYASYAGMIRWHIIYDSKINEFLNTLMVRYDTSYMG